ncbi:MAG TPA: hypothetical protein DEA94_00530 [Rhodobacteraceae bacterium]|nr:hypothetical protein [Paracoccaceae bacterium]
MGEIRCAGHLEKCSACHRMEEKCLINSTSRRLSPQRYSQQAGQQRLPMFQNRLIQLKLS